VQGTIKHARDLASYIDHTLLKPDATEKEIRRLCEEARHFGFKAVCVNPVFVKQTRKWLRRSPVLSVSVVGFPLGTSLTRTKALEAELAVHDGAAEIDMVIRFDLVKERRWKPFEKDISEVVKASGPAPVKVIIETGLLEESEIVRVCKCAESAGAAFIKTSTGFLGRGATVEDVQLIRKTCSPTMKIKASGGIKSFAQALALIEAGADRLGTSSGVLIVNGQEAADGSY